MSRRRRARPRFISLLAAELRLRSEPFDRRDLGEYVAAVWPWVREDPDVHRWVREFLALVRAAVH
jgi:hypothetical protein